MQGTDTPPSKGTLGQALGMGALCSAAILFSGALILRLGLRLSWDAITIPLTILTMLPPAFFTAMFCAGKYRSLRIAALLVGAYFVVLFSTLVHYGSKWGLRTGFEGADLWRFDAFIVAICTGLAFMPRRWTERFYAEGVTCSRCHHNHEGRDCSCGCRVDQFKYPVFGI